MENASKALIIAGAILIAIVLISVGVLIINSTGGLQNMMKNKMSAMEKEAFNQSFLEYEKEKASASDIRSIIQSVNSSNSTNPDNQITITNNSTDCAITGTGSAYKITSIKTGATYKVSLTYTDGIITDIEIT